MYKIVRYYKKGGKRTMKTGLSLAEAKKHCLNPKTAKEGVYFDGFTKM